MNTLTAAITALIAAFCLGVLGGYRYADGQCAKGREESLSVSNEAFARMLEKAEADVKAANGKAAKAAQKTARLERRQSEERKDYANAPKAPDACVLDSGTYGLLIEVVRRANYRDSDHDPD